MQEKKIDERKVARDSVYKLVFEYGSNREENERSLSIFCSEDINLEAKEYIKRVYYGIMQHYDELVMEINEVTKTFRLERIYRLDLAAMILAVYEMKYEKDIPMSVSINEAVELVKLYSTELSYKYVNGVLSAIYKKLIGEKNDNN